MALAELIAGGEEKVSVEAGGVVIVLMAGGGGGIDTVSVETEIETVDVELFWKNEAGTSPPPSGLAVMPDAELVERAVAKADSPRNALTKDDATAVPRAGDNC